MLRLTRRSLLAPMFLLACGVVFLPLESLGQTTSTSAAENAPKQHEFTSIDRVVAVVNNRPILASDLDESLRLSVLEPGPSGSQLSRPEVLEMLISRLLIQQQIREQDEKAAEPSEEEIATRIHELRTELPACVHAHCEDDKQWREFLDARSLTPEQVHNYMHSRLQTLRFIELRFRAGIRVQQEEITDYYQKKLLPQYAAGEKVPALDAVSSRIEEILLQHCLRTGSPTSANREMLRSLIRRWRRPSRRR
jgi:peptidyl-prolyl cis-trans isomerase SurA